MMDTLPNISVIICAYTEARWHDLVAAVASLQRQTIPVGEIIVVVDHNPHLLERVRCELSAVVPVENTGPRGLSGARNSGIAVAQGSLIAFLDDDATAEPDWLELLSHCLEDPRVLGAGGTVAPAWLCKQPYWFPSEFYWVVGCTYLCLPQGPVVVRNPYGGCTCYRREVFEATGGFRNEMGRVGSRPLGCEETELCIRVHQHWPERIFLYEPRARIHHRIPSTRASWHYFCSRCYAEGLSKAAVAGYVGARDGLAAERSYTLRILPQGILRGMAEGLLHRDIAGFRRAGAIIAGLAVTTAGYLVGTISVTLNRRMTRGIEQQGRAWPCHPEHSEGSVVPAGRDSSLRSG